MKKTALIPAQTLFALVLLIISCDNNGAKTAPKKALIGNWRSMDGKTGLKITARQFILDEGGPIAEEYFLKGDTILTSFEGNQPYTKFVIQNLDGQRLDLMFPDSVLVEFGR